MRKAHTSEKKSCQIMYMTYVDEKICPNPNVTRPRNTERKSVDSALNMVAHAILNKRGIETEPPFRKYLEKHLPEILEEASNHISITVQVFVPFGMKPREFRKRYCSDTNFRSQVEIQEIPQIHFSPWWC